MLRMFVGADIDLFHCVDARRAMGREKAFGSALGPRLLLPSQPFLKSSSYSRQTRGPDGS